MEKNKKSFHMKDVLEKWKGEGTGKSRLLILLLCGLLLLIIAIPVKKPSSGSTAGSQENKAEEVNSSDSAQDETEYTKKIEEKLENALASVRGVGKVKVMITLKSSREQVIEKDKETSQSNVTEGDNSGGTRDTSEYTNKEATVYKENTDGKNNPYVIKELEPKLEGVIVISEGGDNPVVIKDISEAVMALFPIEIHKIKVMKMQS